LLVVPETSKELVTPACAAPLTLLAVLVDGAHAAEGSKELWPHTATLQRSNLRDTTNKARGEYGE